MKKIPLAPDGLAFSQLIVGFWRLAAWDYSPSQLADWIAAVLDLGISTFDHADLYGGFACEEIFGAALAQQPSLRGRMEIVTKCDIRPDGLRGVRVKHYDTSSAYIIQQAEGSLRALQTDYLDVLLIHRPDPLMDADAVAEAFGALRAAGKVRHFGVSNFMPHQIDLLNARLDVPLVTNQIEFSVLVPNALYDGTLDQAQRLRMPPMIWSPYAGGRLFGGTDEQSVRVRAALEKLGGSLDQTALAWILRHPSNPLPILGTGKLAHVRSAVAGLQVSLDREAWFSVLEAYHGQPVP